MSKLSKKEIEHLKLYLLLFQKAYYLASGKTLTDVNQLIDLIKGGTFTFEDCFDVFVGSRTENLSDELEDFLLDNLDAFSSENYFGGEKNVGTGAWIKIRTENGFELHYAKRSTRKIRLNEVLDKENTRVNKILAKVTKSISSGEINNELEKLKNNNKLREAQLRSYIGLIPYEVRIRRSKTKTEYYLPYQYEMVTDIDEFADAYKNNTPFLEMKTLFTNENKEAIFYLQSRGISKKVAQILASLNQSYFTFDMVGGMEFLNNQFKSKIVLVESK